MKGMRLISKVCRRLRWGMYRYSVWLSALLGSLFSGGGAWANSDLQATISVVWKHSGASTEQVLHHFTSKELQKLKAGRLRERAPWSERGEEWSGPFLGEVLTESLRNLSPEARAQIDLVVLQGASGGQAWIPRAFITRYPLLLASPSWSTVVPFSSRSEIRTEEVPYGTYWIRDVRRLELTNFRVQFGKFYLKRRTDPAAMRGEKVFVQNCLACHHAAPPPLRDAKQFSHPLVSGYRVLDGRAQKALFQYWNAYQTEQGENR